MQCQLKSIEPNIGECDHRARLGQNQHDFFSLFKILFSSRKLVVYFTTKIFSYVVECDVFKLLVEFFRLNISVSRRLACVHVLGV